MNLTFHSVFTRISLAAAALCLTLSLIACSAPPSPAGGADAGSPGGITLATRPDYTDIPYVELHNGVPTFTEDDYAAAPFETYAELDALGRCGVAYALITPETMPTEEREGIGMIKPTGWHTVRYDDLVDGNYLYNRCHLIGFQLAGENANELNLITGTRYFNVTGMLPFENAVADYVEETGEGVLYRVTPVYEGMDLVAQGVVIEAASVEDGGDDLSFHVFVYNVQPGITIDYRTGESRRADAPTGSADTGEDDGDVIEYIVNKNSLKFHLPSCGGAQSMSEQNRGTFTGTRDAAIAQGYSPCGTCKP